MSPPKEHGDLVDKITDTGNPPGPLASVRVELIRKRQTQSKVRGRKATGLRTLTNDSGAAECTLITAVKRAAQALPPEPVSSTTHIFVVSPTPKGLQFRHDGKTGARDRKKEKQAGSTEEVPACTRVRRTRATPVAVS